ncbi:hypothetical protein LZC95_47280 [Pendulispora brunnea]|uniref:Lipoprotein n=1 Tax=Pendulispora brunnea TaxID=2905690 RepID=A0ABZ2K9J4_9BACT
MPVGTGFGARLRLVLALGIAAWMGACNLNPQPIPPGAEPDSGSPTDGMGNGGGSQQPPRDASLPDAKAVEDAGAGSDASDPRTDAGDAGDGGDAGEDAGDAGDAG